MHVLSILCICHMIGGRFHWAKTFTKFATVYLIIIHKRLFRIYPNKSRARINGWARISTGFRYS